MFFSNAWLWCDRNFNVTLQNIVLRYTFFAFLAIMANLATQRCLLRLGDSTLIFALAIGCGTIIGLVSKYILDKRWIFEDVSTDVKTQAKMFSRYSATGVITTGIFWCTEIAFWFVWQTDMMREVGAIFGLSIGYIVKYHLDRCYVFNNKRLVQPL